MRRPSTVCLFISCLNAKLLLYCFEICTTNLTHSVRDCNAELISLAISSANFTPSVRVIYCSLSTLYLRPIYCHLSFNTIQHLHVEQTMCAFYVARVFRRPAATRFSGVEWKQIGRKIGRCRAALAQSVIHTVTCPSRCASARA